MRYRIFLFSVLLSGTSLFAFQDHAFLLKQQTKLNVDVEHFTLNLFGGRFRSWESIGNL